MGETPHLAPENKARADKVTYADLQRLPSQYFHIVLVISFQQSGSVQPIGAFG
jgi:hypothetical protein